MGLICYARGGHDLEEGGTELEFSTNPMTGSRRLSMEYDTMLGMMWLRNIRWILDPRNEARYRAWSSSIEDYEDEEDTTNTKSRPLQDPAHV